MKKEQSHGGANANQTDSAELNSELVRRKKVENTPFEIISINEQNEHFATLGEYRLTERYKTAEAAEQEVSKITWNRVIQVMMIINEKLKK